MQRYIQYATKSGTTVHISEVESGLACGCYCTNCNSRLVAKKGSKVVHHFAHYNQAECDFAFESSLHLGVKRVLEQERKFLFPSVVVQSMFGKNETARKATILSLDSVRVECRLESIIPDILVNVGKSECILEIYVTHQVDEGKKRKIEKLNIAAVEVDFSHEDRGIDDERIKEILCKNTSLKRWIFNPKQKSFCSELNNVERVKIEKGEVDGFKITQVKYCFDAIFGCPLLPKHRKHWNVSLHHNCFDCDYYISHTDDEIVYCNARFRLWEKLNKYQNKEGARNQSSNLESTRAYLDKLNVCPQCGNMLIVRNGKNGPFFACKGFPSCRYSKSIDQETGELT